MNNNKHIGSSFENFLETEGILEEVNALAIKAVIARKLQKQKNDNAVAKSKTHSAK